MRNHRSGFTLAELLIVVVIIGILAALVVPRFFGQSEKARFAEAVSMLSAARQGEVAYKVENGTSYTGNWTLIGLDDPNPTSSFFTYSLDSSTGAATAVRTSNSSQSVILYPNGTWGGVGPYVPNN